MAIVVVTPGSSGAVINAPLGQGNQSGVNAFGGLEVYKITGISSDIKQATFVTPLTAYNGDVMIEQVIMKTDGTGLAGGTNFQVTTDNAQGLVGILSETVANLGANKTVDMFTASVVKQRTVIEQGKKIRISSTNADCTGAGAWTLYIVARPLTAAATLA